jgi:hypothetical protein
MARDKSEISIEDAIEDRDKTASSLEKKPDVNITPNKLRMGRR